MKKSLFSASFLIIVLSIMSCSNQKKASEETISRKEIKIKGIAEGINNFFASIRKEVGNTAKVLELIYADQDKILKTKIDETYITAENGVMYKPKNDGGSAIFVSGIYPINKEITNIVKFTSVIDTNFKRVISQYPEVSQIYYNDKYSYNRIYPFFDVLSQYEPKMCIPSFNFYYLADSSNNPNKNSVWVKEPYIDPAGRGWMISVVAPVYYRGAMQGVPGIDVTITGMTKRFLLNKEDANIVIIDSKGNLIAAEETAAFIFGFPPFKDHKYVETIKSDTYQSGDYNILKSSDEKVRLAAQSILNHTASRVELKNNNEIRTLIVAPISELDWFLIEII